MSGTWTAVMGERGRVVIPAELREVAGLSEGSHIVFIETPHGIVMVDRERLKSLVRKDLAGTNLVDSLLADRRAEARRENEGT